MGHPTEPGSPSDAELVTAYQAGDERAATELVTRHARAVARYLYGAGAAESEVEDLTQEAFFRAFRKVGSWRGDASFRSWVITIAGNQLKDAYRRRKGRTVLSIEGHDIPDHADPEQELAAEEAGERLRACLGKLPRLQRDVFLLRVQHGAEYAEIARALDTTTGAARVHYHHAVKRLKESVR